MTVASLVSYTTQKFYRLCFLLLITFFSYTPPVYALELKSSLHDYNVDIVVQGLSQPWGMVFLSESEILITERTGQLRLVRNWQLMDEAISGLPPIREIGQGGLLGIALHPEFDRNNLVYLSYAGEDNGRFSTEVLRGRLEGSSLVDIEVIFTALPKDNGGSHFGSRLLFAPDGTLFISLGDRGISPARGRQHPAQQLDSHTGSLIRINDDGSIPSDNPFINQRGAKPEIYTYGNRNMQGMALHPVTKMVWTHEHGPQGGDEINIMRAGTNYGWPVITYGVNYGFGTKIGEGTHAANMEQPLYKWVPSIAPSGMMFYTGDEFLNWKHNLFVGSLKFGQLVRLELAENNSIISEERLLSFEFGRIRDVVQGPDGYIYLLTDNRNGNLLRISPDGRR